METVLSLAKSENAQEVKQLSCLKQGAYSQKLPVSRRISPNQDKSRLKVPSALTIYFQ